MDSVERRHIPASELFSDTENPSDSASTWWAYTLTGNVRNSSISASLGGVAGWALVCAYTMRGTEEDPVRWIISLRKANQGESHAYRTAFLARARSCQGLRVTGHWLRFHLHPVRDIQVLSPINRGPASARAQHRLQGALNPSGERKVERFGRTFGPEAAELTASFEGRAVTYVFSEARYRGLTSPPFTNRKTRNTHSRHDTALH